MLEFPVCILVHTFQMVRFLLLKLQRGQSLIIGRILLEDLKKKIVHRWFQITSKIKENIPNTSIWWNRKLMHCAIYFEENNGLYDITGRINKDGVSVVVSQDLHIIKALSGKILAAPLA